ncbi:putative ADP-ribosylation factor GTPase activating protein [Trypanosoma vivax]|nr:putative ADP-ribosylation factor GTPase activating protein [Trypanosoma vivax]
MADHELSQKNRIGALLKRPENKSCFECLENQPRWASTNLGVFLCLRCAGLHRSLGTHVSKVRSTTMDKWEEHMIRCCECVGNARGRQLYEHNMPESARPGVGGNEISIERFIRSKYEQRAYFHPDCERLLQSLLSGNGAELANSTAGNQLSPTDAGAVAKETLSDLWGDAVTAPVANNSRTANSAAISHNGMSIDDLFSSSNVPQPSMGASFAVDARGLQPSQQPHPPPHGQGSQRGDAKSEIMSLFSSPSGQGAHVYSAWAPVHPSANHLPPR